MATTISNATLTVKIIESVVLNGQNQGASNTLTIEHEESSATANRRFSFPNGQDLVITDVGVYEFRYNSVHNRWLQIRDMVTSVTEDVTATNVITAGESGTTFFLNSATEFVSTLPAPAAGLEYKFFVKAAPSGADYTIVTTSSNNLLIGGFTAQTEDDTGGYHAAGDTITFSASGGCVVGDWCHVISDGTSWYVSGSSKVNTGMTITQAS